MPVQIILPQLLISIQLLAAAQRVGSVKLRGTVTDTLFVVLEENYIGSRTSDESGLGTTNASNTLVPHLFTKFSNTEFVTEM